MTFHTDISRSFMNDDRLFLTDGGFETAMVFHEGIDLPAFSSSVLLETSEGRAAMDRYFDRFLRLAADAGTGFMLDTASWRAGAHWADAVGRSAEEMRALAAASVDAAKETVTRWKDKISPILVNGVLGPAGDGYAPDALLNAEEAAEIHADQIAIFAEKGVDLVSAVTMTHPGEAIGVVRASVAAGLPVVISFTVETDGKLPTGQSVEDAIEEVDAATDSAAMYYMINCAHPDHFRGELSGRWLSRIGGVRANASRMSHAELDEAEVLDDGNPEEFGVLHRDIAAALPNLKVVGGCCGTDHRHVACVSQHLHSTS